MKWVLHQLGFTVWAKTSPVENFKHGLKNDMVVNISTFLCKSRYPKVKFLGQHEALVQGT
jgi:hypothetical protein